MSSQPRLDFNPDLAARIALVPSGTRTDACICCGEPLDPASKTERFCSPACRIEASKARRAAQAYLATCGAPASPESRRNRGKAIAASNHAPDLELARRLALEMLAARGVGTISDLREYAAVKGHELPWHLNWSGAVFLGGAAAAHVKVWFEPTGQRRNSTHLHGNARKVNEYRLTAEGWAAVRGMRG